MERRFRKPIFLPDDPIGSFPVVTHPDRLSIPLTRKKPTVYAVWNDLFHEAVPFEFVDLIYEKMGMSPWPHTYLILTKRPQRLLDYVLNTSTAMGTPLMQAIPQFERPFSQIYHGLTGCNQPELETKIGDFFQVPGNKFLSIEPMLGPVDLHPFLWSHHSEGNRAWAEKGAVDAVILGGETGPGARPLHPDWVRSVRDQCAAAGVDFFFKGWGEWIAPTELNEDFKNSEPKSASIGPERIRWIGKNGSERRIGDGLRQDGDKIIVRIGRKSTGRLLDGRTHDELPWMKP
jgi:protein gp37